MKDKKVLLAKTQKERHRKNQTLLLGSGFFIFLLVIVVTLYGMRSRDDNTSEMISASTALPDSVQLSTENALKTEPFGAHAETSDIPIAIDINDIFLENIRGMQVFSEDFEDLSKAIDAYNQGVRGSYEYESINNLIKSLEEKVLAFVDDSSERIIEAIKAGDQNTFNILKSSISELLVYANESVPFDINDFDDQGFFDAYSAMSKAKSSNDLNGELDALQKMQARYQRESYANRIEEINFTIRNNRIDELETRIISEIDSKNFIAATAVVNQLKNIMPLNKNINNYEASIEAGIKESAVKRYLLLAEDYLRKENFENANAAYEEVLKINSNNNDAIYGAETTDGILKLLADLKELNDAPERLSADNVYLYSNSVITRAEEFIGYQTVALQIKNLQDNLTLFSREIEVTFLSDNKAKIEIRGVGYISPTNMKVVALKPGRYEINTICSGHKNNFFEIKVDEKMESIEAVCGERL